MILKVVIKHNVINFVGFSIVAILNIILVPLIITNYGVEKFGLIALIRYLLPVGILGLFDLGIPEAITRSIAHSRGASLDSKINSIAAFGILLMFSIGVLVAVLFYSIVSMVDNSSDLGNSLHEVLPLMSLTIVIIFPGIAVEAIFKGLENFILIRVVEIIRTIIYFTLVVIVIKYELGFIHIIQALLATYCLHYVVYFLVYSIDSRYPEFNFRNIDRNIFRSFYNYSKAILHGKIMSNIMGNLPPFLIAPIGGMQAVGVYEALMRLPKYVKTVLSIINASVMPVSARLSGAKEHASERQLLIYGTSLSAFIFLPPMLGIMVLSESVLLTWLGEAFARYSLWFAFIFLLPFMTNYLTVGISMLIVHEQELKKINRVALLQVFIFCIIGFTLLGSWPEIAFMVGIVVAQFIAAPFQILLFSKFYSVSVRQYLQPLVWVILSGVVPYLLNIFFNTSDLKLVGIVLTLITWCVIQWATIYFLFMSKDQRQTIVSLFSK